MASPSFPCFWIINTRQTFSYFFFLDGLRPLQRCLYDYRGARSRQADASSPDSWPRPYGAYGNAHASWVQCVALTSPAGTFLFYRYHSFSTTMALSSPGKSREKKANLFLHDPLQWNKKQARRKERDNYFIFHFNEEPAVCRCSNDSHLGLCLRPVWQLTKDKPTVRPNTFGPVA